MYLMFCILHLFIFHGANRIDGGAPRPTVVAKHVS